MKMLVLAGFSESIIKFRGALLSAIQDAGLEVHVGAPSLHDSPSVVDELRQMGVEPHDTPMARVGTNPIADVGYLMKLRSIIGAVRPDISLSYTIKPVIYGTLAAWIAGVPHRFALITGLGYSFTSGRGGAVAWIARAMYRISLHRATKVFFQNPDDERLFRKMGLLHQSVPSVVVNGSGIDTEAFPECALPRGAPVFLMIGRLLGDKGVREYAEAARRVKAKHPEVKFRLVGWIDSNPDAISQSELNSWLVDDTLEFLGKLDDVRPAIAEATVYVLPSYREGTPRTVLEAMAMGRPVITTDAPGCRETVINGDNGFLVSARSVDALEAAMIRFVESPDLLERMGRRSRQVAEEKYDVRKVNDVMMREMGVVPVAHSGGGRNAI